jgi:hypothetical protein
VLPSAYGGNPSIVPALPVARGSVSRALHPGPIGSAIPWDRGCTIPRKLRLEQLQQFALCVAIRRHGAGNFCDGEAPRRMFLKHRDGDSDVLIRLCRRINELFYLLRYLDAQPMRAKQ